MENQRKLRDASIALLILGIAELFKFFSSVIAGLVDGSISAEIAKADPSIVLVVKIRLGFVFALMAFLVFADVLLAIKGLKVSKNPTADKGYIIVAKVFIVLTSIAIICNAISVFTSGSPIVAGVNTASTVLSVCIYSLFTEAAGAVRKDVLAGNQ